MIWSTPYGNNLDDQISGVIVQAHMVSQILSAVLDSRPLLTVWSAWVEIAWIGCWSFLGGILAQRFQYLLTLGLAGGIAIAILYIFCFGLLVWGYWIPFVPPAFTFVFAGLVVQYQKYLLKRQELLKNNLPHNLASKN
ncbi:MAG: CHASE2 domain-containing protein [Aulosira sp. DedQUE10]|nr:CHASE2 domain-containing protein [Aulosira sp. DedQUE10]